MYLLLFILFFFAASFISCAIMYLCPCKKPVKPTAEEVEVVDALELSHNSDRSFEWAYDNPKYNHVHICSSQELSSSFTTDEDA